MNLGTLLPRHARFRGVHTAVVFENNRLTYAEFHRSVNRLANALLGMGVRKGDKIATILPNSLELLETYWAVSRIGAVVVPLSPLLRGSGLASLLNDSDSLLAITDQSFVDILDPVKDQLPAIPPDHYLLTDSDTTPGYRGYHALKAKSGDHDPPAVDLKDEDLYNIIYSSGTTGLPKGIIHTHYVRSNYCTHFASAFRIVPESVILHTGAIVFNGAFLTLMPAMYLGATYILHPQFDASRMIRTIQEEKVTHVDMVPAQVIALLDSPDFGLETCGSLECLLCLGAPLHREHKEELHRRLPGRFYELYGLTEGFVTILDKTDFPRKLSSVGCCPPFFDMKIMTEENREAPVGGVGEIVGRGPILMPGYYKRPEMTEKTIIDGWLYSGDLGFVDAEGYLTLVDRKKDMIISGGINVYPKDIEEIAVQHPAVREAAVFGLPHPKWGETPIAAVILKHQAQTTPGELKEWINARVSAKYQRVEQVILRNEFPRSAAGKTLKRIMRDELLHVPPPA
jgi:acyl-CoA synthetase (AMP-forming)/AMP-acid ligase II